VKKTVKRILIFLLGWTLVLAGLVLSLPLVPGPGFVVILLGLLVLATEYAWAHNLLERMRRRIPKFAEFETAAKHKLRSWFGRRERKPA
jgi:uncharacterized protein (TIGR02611 family)